MEPTILERVIEALRERAEQINKNGQHLDISVKVQNGIPIDLRIELKYRPTRHTGS